MKTLNIPIFFFLLSPLFVWSQYPFENFKAIKYKEYNDWKTLLNPNDSLPILREITIENFNRENSFLQIKQELKLSLPDSIEYSKLEIYKNNQLIKEFEVGTRSIMEPLPVYTGDINGDGLTDLKIIFPNYGSGGYNYYCQVVYLFQNSHSKTFNEIIYTDIFEEFENKPERDFNNDGKYGIITQTFKNYGKHNYWLFNIYNYKNGKLVNVNNLANYPIMIPLNSHKASKNISRKKMKEFEIKSPTE